MADSERVESRNPAQPQDVVFSEDCPYSSVNTAVAHARAAARDWGRRSLSERSDAMSRWKAAVAAQAEALARLITREMGKTLPESRLEVRSVIEKVDICLRPEVLARTCDWGFDASGSRRGECRYVPHGVMAVIGPFNFPAHLPNGHFVPALLAGNTVIFKPSEKTPAVGRMLGELMQVAGFPPGVFTVLQGGAEVAARLVGHADIDGVLFTGSWQVGRRIMEANLDRPGRLLALEMGGNNAAVVMPSANMAQAVIECARSSFITTGQRCTCTRRIIVHESVMPAFRRALCQVASSLVVDAGDAAHPVFMGPIVSAAAADAALAFQTQLAAWGGKILVRASRIDREGSFVTAGVVEVDATGLGQADQSAIPTNGRGSLFAAGRDIEAFAPVVQLSAATSLADALRQANATQFGLAAAIFSNEPGEWEEFRESVRVGCVNLNTGTAGASSRLPFGGFGLSGNHRPAGSASVDYCSAPVASMVERSADAPLPPGMRLDAKWLG